MCRSDLHTEVDKKCERKREGSIQVLWNFRRHTIGFIVWPYGRSLECMISGKLLSGIKSMYVNSLAW